MSNDADKVSTLVIRLANKTRAGLIRWERFSDGVTYQTRQGDFIIKISTSPYGANAITIESTRLDGNRIFVASNQMLVAQMVDPPRATALSQQAGNALGALYNYLKNDNSDLDELLKLI